MQIKKSGFVYRVAFVFSEGKPNRVSIYRLFWMFLWGLANPVVLALTLPLVGHPIFPKKLSLGENPVVYHPLPKIKSEVWWLLKAWLRAKKEKACPIVECVE